ncbi:MAG: type I restriction endonuclease subunit R, partial [Verrucomicrobiaceae bacterium]
MSATLTESVAEEEALRYFEELQYSIQIAQKNDAGPERESLGEIVLVPRLRDAIERLNPCLPEPARAEAIRKVLVQEHPSLVQENRRSHRHLVDGVELEYLRDGRIIGDRARLIDFEVPENNDWLVVSQFTVIEAGHNRRPDITVFLNGLPIAVIELKNASAEDATIWTAFHQLQTYKKDI